MSQSSEPTDMKQKVFNVIWIYLGVLAFILIVMYSTRSTTQSAAVTTIPETTGSSSASGQETVKVEQAPEEKETSKSADNSDKVVNKSPADGAATLAKTSDQASDEKAAVPQEINEFGKTPSTDEKTAEVEKPSAEVAPAGQETKETAQSSPAEETSTAAAFAAATDSDTNQNQELAKSTADPSVPFGLPDVFENSKNKSGVTTCQMKKWDLQFPCDLTWEVDKAKGNTQLVIAKDPVVTLSWYEFNKQIHFLTQLNHFFFEKFDFYGDNFQTERVTFAGHDAILVKGNSKDEPDVERRDYYYLEDNKLLGIFFKVSPSEKWEQGKWIIKRVKDSFSKIL